MKFRSPELRRLLPVVLVAVALLLVFPYDAVSFKACTPRETTSFAAFVTLTPEQELAALQQMASPRASDSAERAYPRMRLVGEALPESARRLPLRLSLPQTRRTGTDMPLPRWAPSLGTTHRGEWPALKVAEQKLPYPREELLILK